VLKGTGKTLEIADFKMLARVLLRGSSVMISFFQNLMQKSTRPESPEGALSQAVPAINAESVATATEPEKQDQAKKKAEAESPRLTLELADFINRIPVSMLKAEQFDLHQPVHLDMDRIVKRVGSGRSTIPLSELVATIPDIFTEDAKSEQTLEIRFPWIKVAGLIKESEKIGGDTLAQKLRERREYCKRFPELPLPESGAKKLTVLPSVLRPASERGNAWFTRTKNANDAGEAEGKDAAQNPASKKPPQNGGPDSALTMLLAETAEKAKREMAAAEALALAPDGSLRIASLPNIVEGKPPGERIAELEDKLKDLASKRQSENAAMRAEIEKEVRKVQTAASTNEIEITTRFAAEREGIAAEKDAKLAKLEAELKSVISAQEAQIA
jgi:hypothetical protein